MSCVHCTSRKSDLVMLRRWNRSSYNSFPTNDITSRVTSVKNVEEKANRKWARVCNVIGPAANNIFMLHGKHDLNN
jgi:hypothetical protein